TFDMTSRFSVDFNELLERDLVMLSQTDFRKDINGSSVLLVEGLPIEVQEDNLYDDGTHEVLFARGVVEANSTGTWSHVKWCCRFDSEGFYDIAGSSVNEEIYNTELSPAEGARVAKLSQAELALIDTALLSQVSDDWRKVARVVGMAMLSTRDLPSGVPDAFFAKRVRLLVESGQLESQGDLRRMRFSEIRRTSA
ncbi:DUF3658 domain-containing protein, partial [Variovorax sp. 22077]|uniref:DUF3658 domain-containing protein n=1 Tax=Variovorax sp. 22077 TaxID=3453867 RepID=UPI003F83F596